jgi:hypothetical protein
MDPKLFAVSRSITRSFDPDPGQDLKLDVNINKNHQKKDLFRNYDHFDTKFKYRYSLKIMV